MTYLALFNDKSLSMTLKDRDQNMYDPQAFF